MAKKSAKTSRKTAKPKTAKRVTKKVRRAPQAKKSAAKTNQKPARAAKPRPAAKTPRESLDATRRRAARIFAELKQRYPDADCALHHHSGLELLVATILSAQCTDERVNMVTPELFRRYPDAPAYANADPAELEEMIRSTGFFRNKTKSLIGMGRGICEEFGGELPQSIAELTRLPGVARKTANCVLGTWFGINEGIVVDTHVGRLALRLGLLRTARNDKDAVKIEQDLIELFPRESWTYLSHALIDHGRQICSARKPKCDQCPLAPDCPSAGEFE